MMVIEQALPLANHAQNAVVDDDDLDIDVVIGNRRKLLAVHHDAAIACEQHDLAVRLADLGPHRRRQAIAHGPLATRGQEMTRLIDVKKLRRPHLMLADIRDGDRIFIRQLADLPDQCSRLDEITFFPIAERTLLAHGDGMLKPILVLCCKCPARSTELFLEQGQGPAQIAEHAVSCHDILIHLSPVELKMHDFGLRRKAGYLAGHPVAEAHADTEQQITLLDGHIGRIRTMHARKA